MHEATPLKKIWCVKLMDDARASEVISGQLNVVQTYLKARYWLSDLLRAQRNDRMTSNLKRWIENGAPDKGDLEAGARRMTPHKSEACRKEIEMLREYDMIEPSKSRRHVGWSWLKRKG